MHPALLAICSIFQQSAERGRQESEGGRRFLVLVRSILLLRRFTTMAGAEGGQAPGDKSQKSPKDFLKAIKGRHVSVKLNHGAEYKGKRVCPCLACVRPRREEPQRTCANLKRRRHRHVIEISR